MDLKVVRTFGTVWEAGMAKSILEAEEIPALVEGQTTRNIGVLAAPGFSEINLLVAEGDLSRAQEVLQQWDESKGPSDKSTDAEEWDTAPEQPGCDEPEDEPDSEAC
jgi:hypothetical protein